MRLPARTVLSFLAFFGGAAFAADRVVLDAESDDVEAARNGVARTLLVRAAADRADEARFAAACRGLAPKVEGFAFPCELEPSLKGTRSLRRADDGELFAPVRKRIELFQGPKPFPFARDLRACARERCGRVTEDGAVGDGVADDTAAIQRTIDRIAAAGGGTVELPPGRYVSGSIYLKDDIDFFLAEGATLVASTNRLAYNAWNVCPQNSTNAVEASWGAHLVLCIGRKNVTVRGPGTINGNSPAFTVSPDGRALGQREIKWRVSQMLYFVDSENIRLENLDLVYASYWSCFLHGCRDVKICGLDVRTDRVRHTMSGDGLDIDCCQDVEVSRCRIDTADDAIAIRANDRRLGGRRPCTRVSVHDCELSGAPDGIRLGVGCGLIEDISFRDLKISACTWAVKFSPSWLKGSATTIRNVRFENIDAEAACFCEIERTRTNELAHVVFRNVRARASYPSYVLGFDAAHPVRDVLFENVESDQPLVRIDADRVEVRGGRFPALALSREELRRNFSKLCRYENRAYWYGAKP